MSCTEVPSETTEGRTGSFSRRAVMAAGGTLAITPWMTVTVGATASGHPEATTDATIPTDTSIDLTAFEDLDGDGSADNQQQEEVNDGTDTIVFEQLVADQGDNPDYWFRIDLETEDTDATPEFHELTITLPEEEPIEQIDTDVEHHVFREWLFPDEITRELTIALFATLGLFLYAAMRLRSLVISVTWAFLILALVFVVLVDVSLVWFWVVAALNAVAVVISIGVAASYDL